MTSFYNDSPLSVPNIPTVGGAARRKPTTLQPGDERRPRPDGMTNPVGGPGPGALPPTPGMPAVPPAVPTTGGIITNTGPGGPDPNPSGPPAPPPILPVNIPGATITPFGPQGDFRSAAITPGPSERVGGASGMVDTAAQGIAGGPSRTQIAMDRLAAFDKASEGQVRDQIRSVGQKAAQYGRLGMGDTSVETLKPYTDYLTQREGLKYNLAADTAEGEISDRFQGFDALSGYEGRSRGYESGQRGEYRDERDFQDQMARDAMDNAFRGRQLESGEFSDDYNRQLQEYLLQLGVDPTAAFLGASNQFGQSAATSVSGAGNVLGDILSRRGK